MNPKKYKSDKCNSGADMMQGTCPDCGRVVYVCLDCFDKGYRPPECECRTNVVVN